MSVRIRDLAELASLSDEMKMILDSSAFNSAQMATLQTLAQYIIAKVASNSTGILATTPVAGGLQVLPHTTDESDTGKFYTASAMPTGTSVLRFGGILEATEMRAAAMKYSAGTVMMYGDETTGCGGLCVLLTNGTGANTVAGTVVTASTTTAMAFELARQYKILGVVLESGIAAGQPAWVQVSGIVPVMLVDGTAATAGYVVLGSTTAGRAAAAMTAEPPTNIELGSLIGWALESVAAGTDVRVRTLITK